MYNAIRASASEIAEMLAFFVFNRRKTKENIEYAHINLRY